MPPKHLSYLLRLYPVSGEGKRVWRAMLESIPGGERAGFPDLESLFEYLKTQAELQARESTAPETDQPPGRS